MQQCCKCIMVKSITQQTLNKFVVGKSAISKMNLQIITFTLRIKGYTSNKWQILNVNLY